MCAAEVEHLLGFSNTADERAGEAAASEDEAEGRDGEGFFRHADQGQVAVPGALGRIHRGPRLHAPRSLRTARPQGALRQGARGTVDELHGD